MQTKETLANSLCLASINRSRTPFIQVCFQSASNLLSDITFFISKKQTSTIKNPKVMPLAAAALAAPALLLLLLSPPSADCRHFGLDDIQDVFDRLGDEILTHQSLGSGSGGSNRLEPVHSVGEDEDEDLVSSWSC